MRDSDERLRMATDNARVGLVMVDRERRYTFANATYAQILGLPSPDIVGQRVADVLAPLYEQQIRPRLDRAFAGERVAYVLHRLTPDGTRHYEVRYEPTEVDGLVSVVVVVITDITDLKNAEMSSRMLAAIVESSDDAIIGKTLDGTITSWNAGAERVFGYSRAEAVGHSMLMLFPQDRYDEEPRIIAQIARGESIDHFETVRVRKDGERIHVSATISPIRDETGRIVGASKIARDITGRKQAALELLESERRFSAMLANVELASVMLDRQARITFCNDYLLQLTGWRREEVLGRNWFELFIPSQYGDGSDFFAALLDNTTETWHRENEILTRSGEPRQMRWHSVLLHSTDGKVIGSASLGEDITERKLAETKIRRLNRVYAVLSQINTLIVRVRDRDELFREACRIAVETGGFYMAFVGVLDRETSRIVPVATAGDDEALVELVRQVLSSVEEASKTLIASSVREKTVAISNDVQHDSRVLLARQYAQSGVLSMAALPLVVADDAVGVLVLYSSETGFFHEEEVQLLKELAGDVAFAIDHIEKSERLDYLAYYDPLTGLANRSLFLERLAQHMRSAATDAHRLAVLLLDLERFKNINDNLGQLAGDDLLKQVARWLERNAGDTTLLARVGADQYAVVLPEVAADGDVASYLQTMLSALLEQPFRLNEAVFRIAAKAGIAVFPNDGDDADALYKHTEAALKQ
ncbi:MAG TPA: PAS domain S-box protein, partial [Xanthomonadaceae bacterium]|nr:PAS domain S-box protein [Xanthomonadaceae bacterium]